MDECSLLSIPDELLLHIARNLEGQARQKSLYNLALVNRQLSHIIFEELYYHPLIQPRYASQFVAQLLDQPKLMRRVTCIEILDGTSSYDEMLHWDEKHFHFGDIDDLADRYLPLTLKCSRALQDVGVTDHSWRWVAGLQDGDPLAYIAVILAITPKLQRLVLSEQYARCVAHPNLTYRNTFGSPSRPYLAKSLEHVSRELQELTLPHGAQDEKFHYTSHPLALSSVNMAVLTSVKSLTVSFTVMSSELSRAQAIRLQLPPNLQKLRITECGLLCVKYLEIFFTREQHKYQHLREIETVWTDPHLSTDSEIVQSIAKSDMNKLSKTAETHGVVINWNLLGACGDFGSTATETGPSQTS